MKNFGAKWLALAAVVGAVAGMSLNGCGGGDDGDRHGRHRRLRGRGGTTGSAGTGGGTAGTAGTTAAPRGNGRHDGHRGHGGATAGTGGGSRRHRRRGRRAPLPRRRDVRHHRRGFALNMFKTERRQPRSSRAARKATLSWSARRRASVPGLAEDRRAVRRLRPVRRPPEDFGATTLKNWTGNKLHVRVKVASGGNPSAGEPGRPALRQHGRAATDYCGGYSTWWPATAGTTTSSTSHLPATAIRRGHRLRRQLQTSATA